jgi:RimJ/RimL family protein N-acetyltransferase
MLTRLNAENIAIIRPLFPKDYPNLAFIYAALEQKINGEAWVDEANHPTATMVICGFYIFVAGNISQKFFDACYPIIIEKIKRLEEMSNNVKTTLSLICPPVMMATNIDFEKLGFAALPRIEYEYKHYPATSRLEENSEYELQPITKDNIGNCLWQRFILDICGEANFPAHLGFMLLEKQSHSVVSEAYGIVGGDLMEICTVTHPDHGKKGLSTSVCNRLILEATKRGLHPIWTCSRDNVPSNKTAKKLGMKPTQEYSFQNIGKR